MTSQLLLRNMVIDLPNILLLQLTRGDDLQLKCISILSLTSNSCHFAGIVPDGKHYQIEAIRKAISSVLDGHLPGVDCNKDGKGNRQLFQVYICVDKDGSTLIECPIFPRSECRGSVEFPVFDASQSHHRYISNSVDATAMKSGL